MRRTTTSMALSDLTPTSPLTSPAPSTQVQAREHTHFGTSALRRAPTRSRAALSPTVASYATLLIPRLLHFCSSQNRLEVEGRMCDPRSPHSSTMQSFGRSNRATRRNNKRGYSSVVEHSTADREVPSSNLGAPCAALHFPSSNGWKRPAKHTPRRHGSAPEARHYHERFRGVAVITSA